MIALALGGRTVAEWRKAMTAREFVQWKAFYELFPFDDLHRIHRPAAMMSAVHTQKGDMQPFLDLLAPEPTMHGMTDADRRTMAAFGYRRKPSKT